MAEETKDVGTRDQPKFVAITEKFERDKRNFLIWSSLLLLLMIFQTGEPISTSLLGGAEGLRADPLVLGAILSTIISYHWLLFEDSTRQVKFSNLTVVNSSKSSSTQRIAEMDVVLLKLSKEKAENIEYINEYIDSIPSKNDNYISSIIQQNEKCREIFQNITDVIKNINKIKYHGKEGEIADQLRSKAISDLNLNAIVSQMTFFIENDVGKDNIRITNFFRAKEINDNNIKNEIKKISRQINFLIDNFDRWNFRNFNIADLLVPRFMGFLSISYYSYCLIILFCK